MAVVVESGRDLSLGQCRERLLASRHGFVSGTRFAMPLIVPAGVDCADGQVRVTAYDRSRCGPLPGHVVALTVGVHPDPPDTGWVVVAVGRLGAPDASRAGGLPLELSSLQGWTYDAAVRMPSQVGPADAAHRQRPRTGEAAASAHEFAEEDGADPSEVVLGFHGASRR